MQHTLLPHNEHAALTHEYHMRLFIVFCFVASVAGLLGIAALFPALMRATAEGNAQLATIASIEKKKNASGLKEIKEELAADSALLAPQSETKNGLRISGVVDSVISIRGTQKLTSISVSMTGADHGTLSLSIQGTAPTRNSLLAFKASLEQLFPNPKAVIDLPISQLAKNSDIQFSIHVTEPLP